MPGHHLGALAASPYRRHRPETVDPRALVFKDLRSDQLTELERLLSKLEGALAAAIRKALEQQRSAVTFEAVLAALESYDIGRALRLLDSEPALAGYQALTPAMQDGLYAAGTLTATSIEGQLRGAQFAFGRLNPRLVNFLQQYPLSLVRQINEQTRESVRTALVDAINAGQNPKAAAVQIKGAIGLTERQAKAAANYRRELETFHEKRTAGGYNLGGKIDRVNGTQVFRPGADGSPLDGIDERRLRDFRFDGVLQRAMDRGAPLKQEQIDRMVDAYERKYLAYRARTIARTEASRVNNEGIQEAWRQAIEQGKVDDALVRRQWVVARDERTCSVCSPVPRLNPKRGVKMGEAFNTPKGSIQAPPAHPNCRCSIFIRQWEPEQLQAAAPAPRPAPKPVVAGPPVAPTPPAPIPPAPVAAPQPSTPADFIALGQQITANLPDAGKNPGRFFRALTARLAQTVGTSTPCQTASPGPGAALIREASLRFPDTWTRVADAFSTLYVEEDQSPNARGYHWLAPPAQQGQPYPHAGFVGTNVVGGASYIYVAAGDVGNAVHEYAHQLQSALPGLDAIFQALHRQRTSTDTLEQLSVLRPGGGYDPGEMTKKDKYIDPYQGKEYADRPPNADAIEVMTMAFEAVLGPVGPTHRRKARRYRFLADTYRSDRGMVDLVVGLLFHWKP